MAINCIKRYDERGGLSYLIKSFPSFRKKKFSWNIATARYPVMKNFKLTFSFSGGHSPRIRFKYLITLSIVNSCQKKWEENFCSVGVSSVFCLSNSSFQLLFLVQWNLIESFPTRTCTSMMLHMKSLINILWNTSIY